ncbi:uncharacterized protein [Antedon mediterranea]|uniref:uncharacterized protein isoform X1 n=1 Tax=Antedon mediterranea TaxID=105859 RepID=UPI003AF49D0A
MGLKVIRKVPPIPPASSTSIAGRIPTAYRNRMLHQSTFGDTIQALPLFIQESEIKRRPLSANTKLKNVVSTLLLSEPGHEYRNELFEACLKQSLVGVLGGVLESLEAVKDALDDVKVMMKNSSEEKQENDTSNNAETEKVEND